MYFGRNMRKNTNEYEEGKELLNNYINEQEQLYQWLKETCVKYQDAVFEVPEFEGFNYYKAVKFIRTWDLINELSMDKKNLFLVHCASGKKYEDTLKIFNGSGKEYKNVATLKVLITQIRNEIRKKYKEKYVDSKTGFYRGDSGIHR